MKGRLPNLLVIGAMKSGTTSLHDYLNEHPDIFMSSPKEIHYYADGAYQEWSKEKYMSFFQSDCIYAGTSPQSYTKCHNKYYQNIPERIFKDTPDVKMIYIVRDPIERYKSHILESYHCDPIEDVEYSKESENYLKTSMYAMQLKAYLEYFRLEQIHILTLESLQKKPLGEMNKIFDFLGIEQMKDANLFKAKRNTAETKKIPRVIRDHLLFRVGMKFNKSLSIKMAEFVANIYLKNQLNKPTLTDLELEQLKLRLSQDINEFKTLTRKEFSQWNI